MAEFAESLNSLKPSVPFPEMDQSLELMNQLGELSGNAMENPSLGFLGFLGFTGDSYFSQQPEFTLPSVDHLFGLLPVECPKPITEAQPVGSVAEESPGDKKRKAMAKQEASSENSTEPASGSEDKNKRRNCPWGGKRGRNNSKEVEKPKEVVHVRARRGQATDSHSLAERVRREKINERMRCLQGLVPGCYKTMGMAGMLDEIINYVQSLQNQVEFLSMKLSAASSFYDFSMHNEAISTQVGNVYEAQEVERLVREGYGGCTSFHSTVPF